MASAKVETWKKTAATAVDGLVKKFEAVAKELSELDKKRKAIRDELRKAADDVSKKIKLDGHDPADEAEVAKFTTAIFERVRKSSALKDHANVVDVNAASTKTSVAIHFDIQWPK